MGNHILVVDDEADIAEMARIRLQANGYSVELAYDGLDAIEKAKRSKPDLIVLDIMMPQIDGLEVCRRLRQLPQTSEIPIIMLTALKSEETQRRSKEVGAQDYLEKPFDGGELLDMVRFYLKR